MRTREGNDQADAVGGAEQVDDGPTDAQTFCEVCIKVLSSKGESMGERLHDNLGEVIKCGLTKCRFCRFVCASFGDEVVQDILREKSSEELPWVSFGTLGSELSESGIVEKIELSWCLMEGWVSSKWKQYTAFANTVRGLDRAIWSLQRPVDFRSRIPTLRAWLEECQNQHEGCKNSLSTNKELASRIIEIREGISMPLIRIISTDGLNLHRTPHVVLSHCWGGEIACSTKKEKIEQYQKSIDVGKLPKSFREAIEITAALGIWYIWIDSLCIIQDDDADWKRESVKMASIFRGATLTLSMSTAKGSSEGCGISVPLPPAIHFTTVKKGKGQPPAFFALKKNAPGENRQETHEVMRNAPVNTRAWIFQEKILSQRILHATQGMFIWQCTAHVETEDSMIHDNSLTNSTPWKILTSHLTGRISNSDVDIRHQWWTWSNDYMVRALTKVQDHYAAFAGVTNLYQDITGDEPILGLWKRDLPIHLAWHASKSNTWTPLKERRVATWTWMTFPHTSIKPNNFSKFEYRVFDGRGKKKELDVWMRYQAEMVSYDIGWDGTALVTAPKYGSLILKGFLDKITLPKNRDPSPSEDSDGFTYLDPDYLDEGFQLEKGHMPSFDAFALFAYEQEGTLVTEPSILLTVYVVLKKLNDEEERYMRIGLVNKWVSLSPEVTVETCLSRPRQTIVLV